MAMVGRQIILKNIGWNLFDYSEMFKEYRALYNVVFSQTPNNRIQRITINDEWHKLCKNKGWSIGWFRKQYRFKPGDLVVHNTMRLRNYPNPLDGINKNDILLVKDVHSSTHEGQVLSLCGKTNYTDSCNFWSGYFIKLEHFNDEITHIPR